MNTKIVVSIALIFGLVAGIALLATTAFASTPVTGKVIALDAGHGGSESGAVNATYQVAEKDVNLAVVYALKQRLEDAGALVVLTREGDETMSSRRERVELAVQKCEAVSGRRCDILISVHHNGSEDSTHDGTLVIYNEKKDISLAQSMLNALVPLTNSNEGFLHGGYGMTVYKNLVSALTEAYYITNDSEAGQFLYGNRVEEEADLQFEGISNYFLNQDSGSGGEGNGKGPKSQNPR